MSMSMMIALVAYMRTEASARAEVTLAYAIAHVDGGCVATVVCNEREKVVTSKCGVR